MFTGRDFGNLRRIFAPNQLHRARFRHCQAAYSRAQQGSTEWGEPARLSIVAKHVERLLEPYRQ